MKGCKKEVLELLESFPRSPDGLGTGRIRNVLRLLGDPHLKHPSVLIGGTNGKGSVAVFTESVLRSNGYITGLYTSPHLKSITERIQVNGKEVPWEELYDALAVVRKAAPPQLGLSYFEALTAAAFLIFHWEGVEMMVLEVGLGGRLDATNVVDPLVSVITNISYDHQHLLGNTLEEIAYEKAGIVRPHTPLVFGTPRELFDSYVEGLVWKKGGIPEVLGREFSFEEKGNLMTYHGEIWKIDNLILGLEGDFQKENAALSLRILEHLEHRGWNFTIPAVRRGLASARWPARLQVIRSSPVTVVDGGHNVGAARRLVETLRKTFRFNRCILVYASKPTKDYRGFLRVMSGVVSEVIVTWTKGLEEPSRIAQEAESFYERVRVERDPISALKRAWSEAGAQDLVLVGGSLYLAGEVLRWMDEEEQGAARGGSP